LLYPKIYIRNKYYIKILKKVTMRTIGDRVSGN
jgi:hypothetical protein